MCQQVGRPPDCDDNSRGPDAVYSRITAQGHGPFFIIFLTFQFALSFSAKALHI